ncbi:SRPBCC family protein [Halobacillus karajensis]|uniref:Polyketide cyclase / dehydrase and lipid transport n=1 Tax=Halobacillus karajensis TaxID=195088 RepID=A0A059NVE9_9BACI|nr:SRPBCC family protein [Halobacillus karajensis]CDQ18644.1 Polyketide cyclase / dehydrase and lipid transport [Halobacillus karajensis]CDQ23284.1 Polyketide cyclase / dehydrase and lipid transport [Halobacillus karajensis]CDQ26766.1 Polyketide cyclase / dehydrase and lipid transport [Halobacillus karajensis]
MTFMNQTVTIGKPLEDVFTTATNFTISPEIMDTVVAVDILSEGPVKEGYRFQETREIRGRKARSIIEVTDFDPNRKYSVRSYQHGLDLRYHYQFVQTSEGTRIDFQGELYTEGLRNKLMKPLITLIIKKEDKDHLEHLKKFIETSS